MKKKKHIIAFAFLTLISLASYAQHTILSGVWRLNIEKSNFGKQSPNSAAVQLNIIHNKKQVTIERKQLFASGDSTVYSEVLPFDGKPTVTTIKVGTTKTSITRWSEEKSQLLVEISYSDGRVATESWLVSDEGNMLTLSRKLKDGEHVDNTVYIYEKQ